MTKAAKREPADLARRDAENLAAFQLLAGRFVVDPFGQIHRVVDQRRWRGRLEFLEDSHPLGAMLLMSEIGEARRTAWPEETAWSPYAHPRSLLEHQIFLCGDLALGIWLARLLRTYAFRLERLDGSIGQRDHFHDRAEAVMQRWTARRGDEYGPPDPEAWRNLTLYRNRLFERWRQAAINRAWNLARIKFGEAVAFRPPARKAAPR